MIDLHHVIGFFTGVACVCWFMAVWGWGFTAGQSITKIQGVKSEDATD